MVNKEIKKLSRRELVDIIYQLKKNEQQMQERITALEEALKDKRMKVSSAGSLAEAAAEVTDIFSTAQATADMYLNEIACMKADAEEECARMIEDARRKAKNILLGREKKDDDSSARYQNAYKKWQQLQTDQHTLDETKKQDSSEDVENG